MKNFVSPHVHVKSLDSASTPEQFAKRELELGTGYITVTDHGTLEATRQVYDLTKEKKQYKSLTPILGLEGYFRDDNCPIFAQQGFQKAADGSYRDHLKYMHITLHALDEPAFGAMCRILSDADLRAEKHGSERKPLFTWKNLEELGSYNITMTSGCLIGMVSRHLLAHNDPYTAVKYYEKLRSVAKPGNFYVEVFPHVCDSNWESGIFVTDIKGVETKFPTWRQVKTAKGPVKLEQLADAFGRNPVKAADEHVAVYEVMENRQWRVLETPMQLTSEKARGNVQKREGFLMNECRGWCPDGDVQLGTNKFMIQMALRYGDPILISDDSHFAYPEERIVQDIRLAQMGNWKFANSYHRFSSEEAYGYFKSKLGMSEKQYEELVENSYAWAEKFKGFKFTSRKTLPTSFYPKDTLRHTMNLIEKHGRMDWNDKERVERLKKEIELLHNNGTVDLLPYFMIDEEVCSLYLRNGQLTGPGRGSAAGLSLAYYMGITHVDPLRYKLSMDRFMTLDRIQTGKLPDIDQDLPSRDLLVDPNDDTKGWLRERFGECVAQISTDITMKLKSAIKDVFRAQKGHVPPEIEEVCKKLPVPPQGITDRDYVFGYKDNDGHWIDGLVATNATLKDFMARYPSQWEIVTKLLGLPRQKSRHACAYVISDEPIKNFIPLTTIGDVRVTQFTAPTVEASGGLKMDFLVVNSLKDIGNAIKLIQKRFPVNLVQDENGGYQIIDGKKVPWIRIVTLNGKTHDIYDLPEDPKVFRDICEGKVETVFQLDAPAAKQGLGNFKPIEGRLPLKSIENLAAFTALDRPGPLDAMVGEGGSQHNMLVEYANRAKGLDPTGDLEVLNKMLKESFGVIVYQEQLQQVFQEVGETTAIEANNFRQRISKKKLVDVNNIDRPLFMKAAKPKLGAVADVLWGQMETFGQYGFNKSHAVCYVVIAYACAWLKHYYPLEWWTAVLQNADRNEIDTRFWRYCGNLIKLPDIRLSGATWEIQDNKIRAPLNLLKGLGEKAHAQLLLTAGANDIKDFLTRIEEWRAKNAKPAVRKNKKTGAEEAYAKKAPTALNDTVLRNLIISGAMDSLFPEKDKFGLPTTIVDRLSAYEEVASQVRGKKNRKGTASKFNLESALVQYQLRKNILPAYSENLAPLAKEAAPDRIRIVGDHVLFADGQDILKVVDAKQFEILTSLDLLPTEDLKVSVLAYVVEDRRFDYTQKTTGLQKTASELTLDVDGVRLNVVRWPSKDGLPDAFQENLKGSVIACKFIRGDGSDSFFLADVVVLASSLKTNSENEESSDV